MAERAGFEPADPERSHDISNVAHSATLPPLRRGAEDTPPRGSSQERGEGSAKRGLGPRVAMEVELDVAGNAARSLRRIEIRERAGSRSLGPRTARGPRTGLVGIGPVDARVAAVPGPARPTPGRRHRTDWVPCGKPIRRALGSIRVPLGGSHGPETRPAPLDPSPRRLTASPPHGTQSVLPGFHADTWEAGFPDPPGWPSPLALHGPAPSPGPFQGTARSHFWVGEGLGAPPGALEALRPLSLRSLRTIIGVPLAYRTSAPPCPKRGKSQSHRDPFRMGSPQP